MDAPWGRMESLCRQLDTSGYDTILLSSKQSKNVARRFARYMNDVVFGSVSQQSSFSEKWYVETRLCEDNKNMYDVYLRKVS